MQETIDAPVSQEIAISTHVITNDGMEVLLEPKEDTVDPNHMTEKGVPSTDDYVRVMIQRANDIVEGEGYNPESVQIKFTPKGPLGNDLDSIIVHWSNGKFVRA